MQFLPRYDEVWVVSDLHMGGASDFQIFNRGARLAHFVKYLKDLRPGDDVALVLNGDIIDSLAEDSVPGYVALDEATAIAMMDRICGDAAFKVVWESFAEFVRAPRRHLVFVVGNHDIELALPPVEAWIRDRLAAGKPVVDARIVFATRGGGFACVVGDKHVFCTHGNEVDEWNVVSQDRLTGLANAMNAGRRVDPSRWEPNAGTRLVIDVMNGVKRIHPFVDLLKPETKPVLGVLMTLDPGLLKRIDLGSVFPIARDLVRGDQTVKNLLGAGVESGPAPTDPSEAVTRLLGENLAQQVGVARRNVDVEDQLLLEAERAISDRKPALEAIEGDPGATLGVRDIVAGWIGLVDKSEALRSSLLDWLANDDTFHLDKRDSTFERIVERVGPGVAFVVTGHTHLARRVEWLPNRIYFNCGTWIRLLRLKRTDLADRASFEKNVYKTLAVGTMAALDEASWILDRTTAVRIARDGPDLTDPAKPGPRPGVVGELLRVDDTTDRLGVIFAVEPKELPE